MPSSTVENYLKQLYAEERADPGRRIGTGRLAAAMRVAPGTATAMIKTLAQSGWADYEPRAGVRLTEQGRVQALQVLRRHRLIELFLVRCLELDWSQVHEEAEALEHVISDRVLDRIDAYLEYPSADPHGAPIPNSDGVLPSRSHVPLSQCMPGERLRVRRVSGQDRDFLVFLDQHGIRLGTCLRVQAVARAAEAMSFQVEEGDSSVTLGLGAAERIRGEILEEKAP